MMKSKVFLILFQIGMVFNFSYASNGDLEKNEDVDEAVFLFKDFLAKVEGGTPFSLAEGEKYFGSVPLPNLRTSLLIQLGYISSRGEWLKPKPKNCPLGELIRMNKKMVLPSDDFGFRYLVGKFRFVKEDRIRVRSFYNIYAQVISEDQYSNDLIGMQYIPSRVSAEQRKTGVLIFPITINGKSIMDDMGLVWKFPGNWYLEPEVARRLEDLLMNE